MKSLIVRLLQEEDGQDLVEYVLLVSLIGLAVTVGISLVATAVTRVFNAVDSNVAQ
jgi:Flp pilus assembly pilin Flp